MRWYEQSTVHLPVALTSVCAATLIYMYRQHIALTFTSLSCSFEEKLTVISKNYIQDMNLTGMLTFFHPFQRFRHAAKVVMVVISFQRALQGYHNKLFSSAMSIAIANYVQ